MHSATDGGAPSIQRPAFTLPDGRVFDGLQAMATARPSDLPVARTTIWLLAHGRPTPSIIEVWSPARVGGSWRTIIHVDPIFAPIAFDAAGPLVSLLDGGRLLRLLLGYAVDPPMSAMNPDAHQTEAGDERALVTTPPTSGVGTDWRAPMDMPMDPIIVTRSGDPGAQSIEIGRPRPNPNDTSTFVCPVALDGLRTNCYGTDGVFALANACSWVERRRPDLYR